MLHVEPAPDQALLTVYSKPKGVIVVDDEDTDETTPATVEIRADQANRIQVRFGDATVSQPKEVIGKAGTRYKVFIRQE